MKTTSNFASSINAIYQTLNNEILALSPAGPVNSIEYRAELQQKLEVAIDNSIVKCDQENNPVDVIMDLCIVADIIVKDSAGMQACTLVFGQPEQAIIVQQKLGR